MKLFLWLSEPVPIAVLFALVIALASASPTAGIFAGLTVLTALVVRRTSGDRSISAMFAFSRRRSATPDESVRSLFNMLSNKMPVGLKLRWVTPAMPMKSAV